MVNWRLPGQFCNHYAMYKTFLVVVPNWLGDVVLATPLFRNIKEKFPSARILVQVHPRVKPVLSYNPFVDEILEFDERSSHRGFFARLNFIRMLKKKHIDTALLLQRSFTRALLCRLAGIKILAGYARKKTNFLLTYKLVINPDFHRMDKYLFFLEVLGIKPDSKTSEVFIPQEDLNKARRLLRRFRSYKGVVVLHPGANWKLKKWPVEYYIRLCDMLMEYGFMVFITGSKVDKRAAERIVCECRHKPLNLCGRTTISEFAAISSNAGIFVSADTGAMHICNSAGGRVLAVFGPTLASLTGPRGRGEKIIIQKDVPCPRPCLNLECRDNFCMKGVLPEEVFGKIKEVFDL